MISPIQITDFALHEATYQQNPAWTQPDEPVVGARVFVRGEHVFGPAGASPPDGEIWLDFDLHTALYPTGDDDSPPISADAVAVGEPYRAVLQVGINDIEGTAARSPFVVTVTCSAIVAVLSLPDDDADGRRLAPVVRANAAGMLYGMARHIVLTLTQTTDAVLLPSLAFQSIVSREREIETTESPTSDGA